MNLPRDGLRPVPVETAAVAHAAFPEGNVYLRLRDELDTLFDDTVFTAVYSIEEQPSVLANSVILRRPLPAAYLPMGKTQVKDGSARPTR